MRRLLVIYIVLISISSVTAQQVVKLSLDETIALARERSAKALEVKNALRIAYWEYQIFRSELLPNVSLVGDIPSYNQSYNRYQNNDGSYRYVTNSSISESLSLGVTQNIPLTGGKIKIESNLERMDDLGGERITDYLAMPISVTLSQPIFSFNALKWDKKLETIEDIRSQKQYIADMEQVSVIAVQHYFELLLSSVNLNIATQNLENAEQLLSIAEGKRKLGLISENDLMQLQYGKINSSAAIVKARQDRDIKMNNLRIFLNLEDGVDIIPDAPGTVPMVNIQSNYVVDKVIDNNPFYEEILKREVSTDRGIALAKSQRGPQADLYASIGYTGNNTTLANSYHNLQNRTVVSLGVSIPILDWRRGKGKVKVAEYQKETTIRQLEEDVDSFEQDIVNLVDRIHNQSQLVDMYKEAAQIAQNRYKIAYETFVMGKISVLDINTAQSEEDNAKRNFINQLYYSWLYHYQLREVSLYDFIENRDIITTYTDSEWTEKYLNKLNSNN